MASVSKTDGFFVQEQNAYLPKQGDSLTEDLKLINNIASEKLSEAARINKLDKMENRISHLKIDLQNWVNQMKEFEQQKPFDHENFTLCYRCPIEFLAN